MNSIVSAFRNEPSPGETTLPVLFEPIAEELQLTHQLYEETVLQTTENQYLHQLITGEGFQFIPPEFRVVIADQIARHLLNGEGKWIRAALVLLSADACGVQGRSVRQVAVAVELVHLATLVHDDIIDEAPMRRGIQSVADGWGNKVAVLLGDFLFSKAFKLLLASESVPAQMLLTHATGQMCLGEIKQLCFSHQEKTDEQDYLQMIENKTASLMAAATAGGAYLGGHDEETVERMHGYGHALGMLFQITDDVLDYTASTVTLGKESGIDMRNGKATLPLIHLIREKGDFVHEILARQAGVEEKTRELLALMRKTGSINYAYALAERYGDSARACLNAVESRLGDSASLRSLYRLIDFILKREK